VGVAETIVGVGGGDVGGMSGFIFELSFAGSRSRLASRSNQRLFSQGWLSALDLPATGYYGCSRRTHVAQTGTWKVSIFAWRLLRDRLPTRVNLAARGILTPEAHMCVSSCGGVESAQHLFLSCNFFGSLWSLV
jgi:hypothetical protein